jgi:dephospho-CoA kinase
MIIAALTGSIAMGKSETAKMFAARGIPVFDSDAAVHSLYAEGGAAVPAIAAIVPAAIVAGAVDRRQLSAAVQAHSSLLPRIEAVVHPLVRDMQLRFLAEAEAAKAGMALLDIPLLFETGRERDVDVVIVVSTSESLQRERALKRPGMTAEKLDFILSKQLPDVEKRARADYVIDTSTSLAETAREVDRVIADIKAKE